MIPSRRAHELAFAMLNSQRICRRARHFAAGLLLMASAWFLALHAFADPVFSSDQKPKPFAVVFVTVMNSDGRVEYGVPVKIRRADSKKTLQEGPSDHAGEIAFRVPMGPGDYVVWADLKADKKSGTKAANPEAKAHVDGDERVDITLHLTE